MLQYCCCCYFVYLFLFCFLTPLLSLCIGHTAYVCVCVCVCVFPAKFALATCQFTCRCALSYAPLLRFLSSPIYVRTIVYVYMCVCVSEWFVPHVAPSSTTPLLFLLLQLVLCCHCCLPLPLVSFARCTLCFALYSLVSLVPTFGIIVFASQWCWQRLC